MSRTTLSTADAPSAIGPYSQAVRAGGMVFCSGQIPLNAQGELVEGSIADQTRQVLRNLEAVLKSADLTLASVVKTTCFLTNLGDFKEMNAAYAEFFPENPPARATVEVSALPAGVAVEIDCIAVVGEG